MKENWSRRGRAASQLGRTAIVDRLSDSLMTPPEPPTKRQIVGRVSFPGKATAVVGMRRAGKTTFLHQVRWERFEREVAPERLPYINLEDERLAGFGLKDFSILVEEYYRRFPALRGREMVTWCFDEIQVVPDWERFVRRLLDTETVEVFVTGSSAALLSREIATAMRGRAWEVVVFPFSFEEYLRHHQHQSPVPGQMLSTRERTRLQGALREYLVAGGFPEAQGLAAADRARLLSDYVDIAMLRDVVERHGVTNVEALRWLVRHVLGNPGGLFSVERFYRTLKAQGLQVSRDTLHQLLGYLEDCFLIRLTWMEATSERQRMVHPRKVHPVDAGLIPVFDKSGKANLGHALESAVRVDLERRRADVRYVRTGEGFEVDFLARWADGGQALIQVAADLDDVTTRDREVRALLAAAGEHRRASPVLVTLTPESAVDIPEQIEVHDAAIWLLATGVDDAGAARPGAGR